MKRIFIINGEAGSGKDLFVNLCAEVLMEKTGRLGFVWNYSSVDKVKSIAKLCGWDGIKTPKARKFLSDLKDLTDEFSNLSYNSISEKIREFEEDDKSLILFIHSREPEQIELLCKNFNASSILIKRNNYKTDASNHADMYVYNFDYDYEIINPGDTQEHYKKSVRTFLNTVLNSVYAA